MKRLGAQLPIFTVLLFVLLVDAGFEEAGYCACGAFQLEPDLPEPVFQQNLPLQLPCTAKGSETCQKLCISLAQATGSNRADLLCALLKRDVSHLIVGIKSKSCDQDEWLFTGLSSKPMCCLGGKSVDCK